MIRMLAPYIVLATAPVVVLLVIAWRRYHWLVAALTVGSLLGGVLAFAATAVSGEGSQVTPLLAVDLYGFYYSTLILLASAVVAVLAFGYLDRAAPLPEEFYVLLLTGAFGGVVLAGATHFASFFLGLEILSVSLYAMVAYPWERLRSTEAALKYLILAGASSAFLVFGMALVYARVGRLDFAGVGASAAVANPDGVLLAGFGMMLVGVGFKLAVVPFHLWTPDVYEGAPAPVTAFIATVSKGAMFALMLRLFTAVDVEVLRSVWTAFAAIAIASMVAGNLLALLQRNVKRLLAYSSIAHLGYLLVAFLSFGEEAMAAAAFYLAAYFVTILGAFGAITLLSGPERDADMLEDYAGLLWRRPWIGSMFALMLFSLAGIPLTAGFIAKIYVVTAGELSARWLLVATLVVTSALSIVYYLRVLVAMIRPAGETRHVKSVAWSGMGVLVGLTGLLVWMGGLPGRFFAIVEALATLP